MVQPRGRGCRRDPLKSEDMLEADEGEGEGESGGVHTCRAEGIDSSSGIGIGTDTSFFPVYARWDEILQSFDVCFAQLSTLLCLHVYVDTHWHVHRCNVCMHVLVVVIVMF